MGLEKKETRRIENYIAIHYAAVKLNSLKTQNFLIFLCWLHMFDCLNFIISSFMLFSLLSLLEP